MADTSSTIVGAAKSDHHEQPFRLLDLPPELWSMICQVAVVREDRIEIDLSGTSEERQSAVAQPSITRVCRLLRAEALPFFYALNVFRAIDQDKVSEASPRLQRWLRGIGSKNRGYLRKLEVFAPRGILDSGSHFLDGGQDFGNVELELELVEVEERPDEKDQDETQEDRTYIVHFTPED